MLKVTLIPTLVDNYCYFLQDIETGKTALVDPGETDPVKTYLKNHNQSLDLIFLTHHHSDHISGAHALRQEFGALIAGFGEDQDRLPALDIHLIDKDHICLGNSTAQILHVPGHTTGHIAIYFKEDACLFTGDTLFSLGCGRLFEGTALDMWTSLEKLASLPDPTRLFCGHEYTLSNLRFALSLAPDDKVLLIEKRRLESLRANGSPTLPSTLAFEKRFNPFFIQHKAQSAPQRKALLDLFTERRRLKDHFI